MESLSISISSFAIGNKAISAPMALAGGLQLGSGAEPTSPTTGQGGQAVQPL